MALYFIVNIKHLFGRVTLIFNHFTKLWDEVCIYGICTACVARLFE
jgi:hypothetical protein